MAKKLVIIEAPGKKSKIQKFLGSGYDVIATAGHIIDLPEKKISVDIRHDFEPTYAVMPGKEDIVKTIKYKSKKASEVFLATDDDREGEAIAWHISRILPEGTNFKRIKYNSITKAAVQKAIQNPVDLDLDLVAAYETRRILDRLVGYKCSFITQQATGGKSAGRCQSAGLRIIADREKEIQAFIPTIYWPIEAELLTDKKEKIVASIKKPKPLKISTKEQAEEIMGILKEGPVKVSKYDSNQRNQNPYPPFTTSTMLQGAATCLNMTSKRTKSAAQTLYSEGLVTYIRSDSTYVDPGALAEARNFISNEYPNSYLPSKAKVYASKQKNAQEAHEAIRPTDPMLRNVNSYSLNNDAKKLYQLIWKRFIASQMNPATYLKSSAEFSCEDYVLTASGSKQLFDGFRKVWTYSSVNDSYLPELKVGEKVDVIDIKTERKETQPPPRYTEASFIKELEKKGIGRPATYESIFQTIVDRNYVEKNKNSLVATELGIRVSDFLVLANFCFADLDFSADMESQLDSIARSTKDKLEALQAFWCRLRQDLENAKQAKQEANKSDYPCPECAKKDINAKLVKKFSKYGPFYSCENYSDKDIKCKYTAQVGENDEPIEKVKKEVEYSDTKCPSCGAKMAIRTSKYGQFLGCSKYPKCKTICDMEGNLIKKGKSKGKKKYSKRKKSSKRKKQ
jgi:DNA topoisomerase-1